MSNITTLQELRKRAEYLAGKSYGGVCDVRTLLACLDGLAMELDTAADWESGYGDDLSLGKETAYRRVSQRLRGLEAKL